MKLKIFSSSKLKAVLRVSLIAGLFVGWINQATAEDNSSCHGETCNNQDPIQYRCDRDAVVVEEVSVVVTRWQEDWQSRQVFVQKLFSERCLASWTNAYVPSDAFLFVREQEIVNGTQSIRGMIQADGTDYVWTQSRMSDGSVANQACVSIPLFSVSAGHALHDRYCTDFGLNSASNHSRNLIYTNYTSTKFSALLS